MVTTGASPVCRSGSRRRYSLPSACAVAKMPRVLQTTRHLQKYKNDKIGEDVMGAGDTMGNENASIELMDQGQCIIGL